MFWIFDEKKFKKCVITHTDISVVTQQCLHRAMDFFAPCAALPESRLGVPKKLGGDTARTADSD